MRPYPTPWFPNKPAQEAAAPGPRIYTGRARLRIVPEQGTTFRLQDGTGRVYRRGALDEIEYYISEQLRRGRFRVATEQRYEEPTAKGPQRRDPHGRFA